MKGCSTKNWWGSPKSPTSKREHLPLVVLANRKMGAPPNPRTRVRRKGATDEHRWKEGGERERVARLLARRAIRLLPGPSGHGARPAHTPSPKGDTWNRRSLWHWQELRPETTHYENCSRLMVVDLGPREKRISEFPNFRIANCELRIANCELRIANCELRIANWKRAFCLAIRQERIETSARAPCGG